MVRTRRAHAAEQQPGEEVARRFTRRHLGVGEEHTVTSGGFIGGWGEAMEVGDDRRHGSGSRDPSKSTEESGVDSVGERKSSYL